MSPPSTVLPHAFGGPNHDDSVPVDAPTTTVTPQDPFNNVLTTSVINSLQYILWVGEIYCQQHYLFDKNVKHVTPTTVKMAQVDNETSVSNQGCHISNSPQSHESKQLCTLLGVSSVD